MKKILDYLCSKCKEEIEKEAYKSYDEEPYHFEGCYAMVDLKGNSQIEVTCKKNGTHEVLIYHDSGNEDSNLEKYITDYLDNNADEQAQWQDAYDNDDWRDVDPGCDPAFPHVGDYERYKFGNWAI